MNEITKNKRLYLDSGAISEPLTPLQNRGLMDRLSELFGEYMAWNIYALLSKPGGTAIIGKIND
jgi:hypothetical protein